jgi:hypothetical protein
MVDCMVAGYNKYQRLHDLADWCATPFNEEQLEWMGFHASFWRLMLSLENGLVLMTFGRARPLHRQGRICWPGGYWSISARRLMPLLKGLLPDGRHLGRK